MASTGRLFQLLDCIMCASALRAIEAPEEPMAGTSTGSYSSSGCSWRMAWKKAEESAVGEGHIGRCRCQARSGKCHSGHGCREWPWSSCKRAPQWT